MKIDTQQKLANETVPETEASETVGWRLAEYKRNKNITRRRDSFTLIGKRGHGTTLQ